MTTVVLEGALAAGLGEVSPAMRVIHREIARRRPWRPRAAWRTVSHDAAFSALGEAPADAIVLARAPEADPGAACVAAAGRLSGRRVLVLPEPFDAALWVAAMAVLWGASGLSDIHRAVSVACGAASGHGALSGTAWRGGALGVPDLPPRVLGRWASRAFVACAWCRSGGGLAGAACATCGVPVPIAAAASPAGDNVVPLRRIA